MKVKMKINILFTLLFSCIMSLSAQKTFELAQLIPGNKDYLSPESPKGVAWFEDVLVYNNNGEICSFNTNVKQNVAPLITISDYNEALKNNTIITLT